MHLLVSLLWVAPTYTNLEEVNSNADGVSKQAWGELQPDCKTLHYMGEVNSSSGELQPDFKSFRVPKDSDKLCSTCGGCENGNNPPHERKAEQAKLEHYC